jgi:hypothetical protein
MKAAFSAPRGVWTTIIILAAITAINDFWMTLQHHPIMSSEQQVQAVLGSLFGTFIGGVFFWWVLWAAGKGTWLGIRRLIRRQKPV